LRSGLSPSDLARRLEAATVKSQPWLKAAPPGKQFEGVVTSSGFRLVRITRGMNTYLPRLEGTVRADEHSGSKVAVAVAVQPVAVAIVLAFFGSMLVLSLRAGDSIVEPVLLLAGFHIGLYFVGFRPEVLAARAALQQVLAAA
jgi:hypothetical protein